MQEAVENKKVELMRLGTKIPAKDVDVLCLIHTLDLYKLSNDGINKYNDRNTVQGFINVMVGNTNVPTVVESSDKVTPTSNLGKANSVVVHGNNHGNTTRRHWMEIQQHPWCPHCERKGKIIVWMG